MEFVQSYGGPRSREAFHEMTITVNVALASVTQWIECQSSKLVVAGSSPAGCASCDTLCRHDDEDETLCEVPSVSTPRTILAIERPELFAHRMQALHEPDATTSRCPSSRARSPTTESSVSHLSTLCEADRQSRGTTERCMGARS
jgi:hypothetical protein